MQSVVTSFQTVAGLGNAAPFVSSAIRAISNHFGSLKNAILDQLHFSANATTTTPPSPADSIVAKDDQISKLVWASKTGLGRSPIQNLTNSQRSASRSQRGLPEHAVAVLRKWLFEHFLHPYVIDY